MRAWMIRALVVLAATCGVMATTVGPASAHNSRGHHKHHATVLTTVLTGAQEVPGPGDEDGIGTFVAVIKGDQLCYLLTARKIEPAMAAHIHPGPRGVAGGIAVGLNPPTDGLSFGCIRTVPDDQDSTMTLTESELAAILANPKNFYVNVHTASFPAGAIRGQLH
ncbi:MAG TPA: CHRD domain-containing protein [Actinopolymorphaceae bacterium]|jgi:hypothetical protein